MDLWSYLSCVGVTALCCYVVYCAVRFPTRSAFEQRCMNLTEGTDKKNYFSTSECFQEQLQEDKTINVV